MSQNDQPTLEGLTASDAFNVIGTLVDLAADTGNLKLAEYALELSNELEARGISDAEASLLDYFRANAWSCRYDRRHQEGDRVWDFEQEELQQTIFFLRRAAHGPGFSELDALRRCQILTNLGNQFDALGRFIEARACFSSALLIDPNFWMARANRGRSFDFFSFVLYDGGHRAVFAYHAHQDLARAVKTIPSYPHLGDRRLKSVFKKSADQIASRIDIRSMRRSYKPDAWPLGKSSKEQRYRRWCLEHTLFLNPLNDAVQQSIAAQDVLCLPDFVVSTREPPSVIGMFNELKQLFCSARWLLWEGLYTNRSHFSDRGVVLLNTLDYAAYGISVEKCKISFRLGYSIFDKVAFFLNQYFKLGIADRDVSFRSVWREKRSEQLREPLANSRNWPLRGLYWLSKDLFEKGVRDTTEPDARNLADLRNHLEHKYVKVLEISLPDHLLDRNFHDTSAYHIDQEELERKTLRLLQLARSALVYLAMAMHIEERRRDEGREGLSFPMLLDTLPDDWKR